MKLKPVNVSSLWHQRRKEMPLKYSWPAQYKGTGWDLLRLWIAWFYVSWVKQLFKLVQRKYSGVTHALRKKIVWLSRFLALSLAAKLTSMTIVFIFEYLLW